MHEHRGFFQTLAWGSAAALVSLFVCSGIYSQTTTGSIVGTIKDATGSIIPGVSVTIADEGTGARREVSTNQEGQYTASLLPVGTYSITAERQGFKKQTVQHVLLQVNQTAREDINLEVGATTQTVQVTSSVHLLKTDTSDVGVVIGEKSVVELPLNGRNYLQMATLGPGTLPLTHINGGQAGVGIVANGADSNANNDTLDGMENQDWLEPRPALKPSPDAIAEFKVMTGTYSAEYGRASGAIINVVTKSGTNQFRGNVYEFLRNNDLDSRNFFDKQIAPFRQNQFGGTFGGPIIKNETFFFYNYDGFRQSKGITVNAIMPTAAQRNGNLAGGPQIYDPSTTHTDPVTGQIIRTPFAGNIIPANQISRQSANALSVMFPDAQTQTPNLPNSIFQPNQLDNYNQHLVRIDHNMHNGRDRFWGHWSMNKEPTVQVAYTGASGVPGGETSLNFFQENVNVGYTRNFGPNLVNDFRIGYNRFAQNLFSTDTRDIVDKIGILGTIKDPSVVGPPNINITGIASVGSFQFAPSKPTTNGFEPSDTLALVKGSHYLKFGADIRRNQLNGEQFPNARGNYSFNGRFSGNVQSPTNSGQGLADFLLGFPSSDTITRGRTDADIRQVNAGFYAQDDWKARPDLTINMGVRYEYLPQGVSARDRISNWDEANQAIVTAQNNLNSIPSCAGCNGRTLASIESDFAGIFNFETAAQAGWPRSLINMDHTTLAPRVGFAWRVRGSNKTVVRGGWGKFYEVMPGNWWWNMTDNPPYSKSLSYSSNTNTVPILTLQNPFPSTGGLGAPGLTGGILRQWRQPYQSNYNLTVERQLLPSTTFSVGYVGSRGTGIPTTVDFNSAQFGILPALQLEPHPSHGSTSLGASWGHRWYDSMQLEMKTRARSLTILGSYTWAHSITEGGGGIGDTLNAAGFNWNYFGVRRPVLSGSLGDSDFYFTALRGSSGQDVRHRLVASYVWDVPVGKGKRFNVAGPLDWVIGGWELTGITLYQSGFPLGLSDALIGGRPNVVGNPAQDAPHGVAQWFNTAAFQHPPDTFTQVVNGNLNPFLALGTAGRTSVFGPGLKNWDTGLFKNFAYKEAYNVQLRVETFNTFNTPYFGDPGTALGTTTFGRITTASDGRNIQVALKFYF